MNKKVIIVIVIVLALCCCVIAGAVGILVLRTPQTISDVQFSLKDNERKDFLNRVNVRVNSAFSEKGYPTLKLDATSPYLVTINSDLLENIEDTSVNLKTDFCYSTGANNQYSLKIKYTDGSVYSLGNSEILCNL
ncbi:MAG: hypothetical protein ACMG57_00095 [Candidatus Dojkabacteria bacterium]